MFKGQALRDGFTEEEILGLAGMLDRLEAFLNIPVEDIMNGDTGQ